MGVTLKILWIPHTSPHLTTMYKLMLTSLLAVASSLPLEDTPEVAAAKAEFKAAFDAASAGAHAALAPVNNDLQAEQIALSYLADSEDIAAAKADFLAALTPRLLEVWLPSRLQLQCTPSQLQLPWPPLSLLSPPPSPTVATLTLLVSHTLDSHTLGMLVCQ